MSNKSTAEELRLVPVPAPGSKRPKIPNNLGPNKNCSKKKTIAIFLSRSPSAMSMKVPSIFYST